MVNKYLMMLVACVMIFGACGEDMADGYQPTSVPPYAKQADQDFQIYLCFGQSNMEGNAIAEDIDKGWNNDRFKVMTVAADDLQELGREAGKWYTAAPPLCRYGTGTDYTIGLTPADYFGRAMVTALPNKTKVGVVMVAMGGSGIDAFDKENYRDYYNSADDWQKGLMNVYGGNPYAKLVEMAKKAQQSGVIKGILIHQGESNNMQQDWPQKVSKIYNDLLTDLELKGNEVPLLAGEMLYQNQGGVCWGHNSVIAKLPEVIENAHVISADGCPGADQFHFTATGYRELGKRYAATMLSLLDEQTAPPLTRPKLHVDGRYLKDENGNIVNLHGFTQTYSPFFNNSQWSNYDVAGCLRYNQGEIDALLSAGWKFDFVRLHMDPYWSDRIGCAHTDHEYRYEGHGCFDENRFKNSLNSVFIPMAEYAISKGLYVVMRPPGVSPHQIAVGDDYFDFLMKVWTIVSQHPKIKGNDKIMFELANEPIDIVGTDGTVGNGWNMAQFESMNRFMQPIVDRIRESASNIIWVPGLGYQSQYSGFAAHPITGQDIGYAVHLYPGWMGSDGYNPDAGIYGDGGYVPFKNGWDNQVKPVADFAPIIITEMDWAPAEYNPTGHDMTWGTAKTGTAGGAGFGANYKKIVDDSGNVSWLVFTTNGVMLAEIHNPAHQHYGFLRDPEAFVWPCYNWFKEYAEGSGGDKDNDPSLFPLTAAGFNPNVWDPDSPTGTFDEDTKTLVTGQYGFAGWEFTPAANMSNYKYLILEYEHDVTNAYWDDAEGGFFLLRIFTDNYWSGMYATYPLGKNSQKMVVNLNQMYKYDDNSVKLSPSNISIVGIWSPGEEPIVIKNAYLTDKLE